MDHTYQSNLKILCLHDNINTNIESDYEPCVDSIEALVPPRHKALDPRQDSSPTSLSLDYFEAHKRMDRPEYEQSQESPELRKLLTPAKNPERTSEKEKDSDPDTDAGCLCTQAKNMGFLSKLWNPNPDFRLQNWGSCSEIWKSTTSVADLKNPKI